MNKTSNSAEYVVDTVLTRALRRLYEYDQAAVIAKRNFRQSRNMVLIVVMLGTLAALLTSYIGEVPYIRIILGSAATVLPILAGYLTSDIQDHSKTTSWLTFRLVAERIRSQIWLYRMAAGVYAKEPPQNRDDKLNEEIYDKNITVGTQDNVKLEEKEVDSGTLTDVDTSKFASDELPIDGYRDPSNYKTSTFYQTYVDEFQLNMPGVSMQHYLRIRAEAQIQWYERSMQRNGRINRRFKRIAASVLYLGAIFPPLVFLTNAATEWIAIASLTNILSYSINTWLSVATFGYTVGLFRITRDELNFLLGKWDSLKDNSDYEAKRTDFQTGIVTEIEEMLSWEREKWYESLLQSVNTVDDAFFKALEELQTSDKYKSASTTALPSQRAEQDKL